MQIKYVGEEKFLKHSYYIGPGPGNRWRSSTGNKGQFGTAPKWDKDYDIKRNPTYAQSDPTIHLNYKNPSHDDINYYRNAGTRENINKYQYKTTDENGNEQYFYTDKGAKRYAQEESENQARSRKNRLDEEALQDTKRWVRDDYKNFSDAAKNVSEAARGTSNMIDMFNKPKANKRINLDEMTDEELRNILNRERMEREYNNYFNEAQTNKGADYAKKFFDFLAWSGQQAMTAAQIVSIVRSFR